MKTILLAHAARYPLMKPRDAVKLIYQNEFGGSHLIENEAACMEYLLREYRQTHPSYVLPLLESIGNGVFRVHLAALDAHDYTPEALAADFIRSSAIHRGSMEQFRSKLSVLLTLTREGAMPFDEEALCAYLDHYAAQGFPPVSHSDTYRAAYHPAYRVVDSCCLPERLASRMP